MSSSSPTSSSYSPFASSSGPSMLPIMALRGRIIEKIQQNRVTLIVGETGCGKSSQVPQFLLEENLEPILCTQPRRFAVVAVARMVAKARNCQVGGEVGYHIGHTKVLSERSKIVFKTAGVLLEEMRDKGLNALKYKVIILDEVHERSVESDLVLVCVKQFLLKNNDLRVVLMSATADIARYRDYFKDLGRGERVEVLAIPNSSQHMIFQRRVSYLEQISELLGISSELLSMRCCSGRSPSTAEANIKPEVHKLIHDLVLHIHENEPDIEKSILVFLPTYSSLEQQWFLLKPLSSSFKVHILHRSIDTEQALMAMRIWKSHRKVILATNIAESSVTIPKVAFVIDSCRSLQVFWDSNWKKDSAELVWVSKSQAEQRRGRTGRTCDGQIYRLVTGSFFNKLEEHELPSILRLSLRQQVLLICCAESKSINDPKVLLQKALDPPDSRVVQDALRFLVHINALEKPSPRGRYEPTFYGRLLASFSLSFDASVIILKFGDIGMLREGILFGILMDTLPLPILQPFGQESLFVEYTNCYYCGDNSNSAVNGRKEAIFMANLCAFQFWQRVFKDKHRLQRLKQLLTYDETEAAELLLPQIEEEWCSFHNLLQSPLNHVAEICNFFFPIILLVILVDIYLWRILPFADEDVLNSIHRFRPKFLVTSDALPFYYDPYEFRHTCLLDCLSSVDVDVLATDDEHLEPVCDARKCIAVPFVASNHFQTSKVAENLASVIKQIRLQYTEETPGNQLNGFHIDGAHFTSEASLCKYFVRGLCNRGNQCLFSHSLNAKGPVCKFFSSLQGCRNGDACVFSHDLSPSALSCSESSLCFQEDEHADASSFLRFFPTSSTEFILLLDDSDLHFSTHISRHCDPSRIISTTCLPYRPITDSSLTGIRIICGLSHPYQTIISKAGENPIPWTEVKFILWFPKFDGYNENLDGQKNLIRTFFEYLAIRLLADAIYDVQVILTMNNIRFSQLQVEKLGRDSFFFLKESFPYDETSFGELFDVVSTKKAMLVSKPISYIFELHPPTDIQFSDYTTVLHQHLHKIQ